MPGSNLSLPIALPQPPSATGSGTKESSRGSKNDGTKVVQLGGEERLSDPASTTRSGSPGRSGSMHRASDRRQTPSAQVDAGKPKPKNSKFSFPALARLMGVRRRAQR